MKAMSSDTDDLRIIQTLGELLAALATLDPSKVVRMAGDLSDGEGLGFSAWYDPYDISLGHLPTALCVDTPTGYDFDGPPIDPALTVGELLDVALKVDGGKLEGRTGGAYKMGRDSKLWADDCYPWTGYRVLDLVDTPDAVVVRRIEVGY